MKNAPHNAPMVVPCSDAVLRVRDTILEYMEHPNDKTKKPLKRFERFKDYLCEDPPHK